MEIKDCLLQKLTSAGDGYVSGEAVAEEIGVSRNAVSKTAAQLRAEGFKIDSSPKKGYRFSRDNLKCPACCISNYTKYQPPVIITAGSVTSTNEEVKILAREGAPEGLLLTAEEQVCGKGRTGKTFFSPRGTGIYMSILLYPSIPAEDAKLITTCAAVAVCRAIEPISDKPAKIKWVNDVYCGDRKVCGILTEGSLDVESGMISKAVLGIGINLFPPESGFGMLTGIAGTVLKSAQNGWDVKGRVIAAVYDNFMEEYRRFPNGSFIREYIGKSYLPGREISVLKQSGSSDAVAVKIGDDLRLLVRYNDGTEEWLNSGEVSIKAK
ncbi:MAG: biotin--[Clostridia bacterium]|nr:biotin--[acetyl-CoA-carboxylase] ligase [Clostridia bacterium]